MGKKRKRRIQGKPNNKNKHLWFYLYKKKIILFQNIVSKKLVYNITFYLHFLCVAGYLKRSNHTPNLIIDKYANYNIIEIYINRLNTAMQISIAKDQLILISEKYLHCKIKACGKEIFDPHRRSNWIHVLRKYFSNYVYLTKT